MIKDAAKAGEISPSVMKIIMKKNNEFNFDVKKESPIKKIFKKKKDKRVIIDKTDIMAYVKGADTDAQVIRRVRTAIMQGDISPSVMKLLLNKDNAGIIFSDEIVRAIFPHTKGKIQPCRNTCQNVTRSKSLKITEASMMPSLKQTLSERRTNCANYNFCPERKTRRKIPVFPGAPTVNTRNIMFDGMPKYTTQAVFTVQQTENMLTPRYGITYPGKSSAPCKCGSETCRKEWLNMKLSNMKLTESEARLIACVCGTKMSDYESKKILNSIEKAKKAQIMRKEQQRFKEDQKNIQKKINKLKKKQQIVELNYRIKKRKMEEKRKRNLKKRCNKLDAPYQKHRKEMDRRAWKQVRERKDLSRCALAAESALDAGTFSVRAILKFIRLTCTALRHPKDSYHDLKTALKDPCCSVRKLRQFYDDEGIYEPAARIKHRVGFVTEKLTKKMESFKKKRRRPVNFGCNLYMASRNKTPCLWVFYACPWFYPQCISLLSGLRHFSRMLMLMLAFIVWSPCLFCFCPTCLKVR
ncbi:uncharacterized protein LOC124630524 [Helicoverpa zea]|uniref:uncharacterized protein LOC124630524 n=1 Tax=Helicoverpa zea TaxID=7113 RepID=UPI001F59A800|nr:uncharacterized protein LOC124630524 [Helicoverpa zea]